MSSNAVSAITESRPPASDYLTYLTILESHLSPEILPTLNDILQDVQLTQNIGWDLVQLLLPLPGAESCLTTIARLGNPREVVLKITEALQLLEWDNEDSEEERAQDRGSNGAAPTTVDKFCILTRLLAILLPRIKTKYPSRFLSTSLIALLATFRPLDQATLAVVAFIHTISGKKRPPLPGRKSSGNVLSLTLSSTESAPDPEAQEEDPNEAAIQKRLLQSFVTHVLEEYINANPLEWATRLQEHYDPQKVVTNVESGKQGWGTAFKEQPKLQEREAIVGQLVALARDLGLSDYAALFEAIYATDTQISTDDPEDDYPRTPSAIPLSKSGSLFLITAFIFSATLFDSKSNTPQLCIFPDHAKLVSKFVGINGLANIGGEEPGVIDAIVAIGVWLEENNNFVGGPLEDEEFLQLLQSLSLLSANNPSSSLRNASHNLTSSILHAHPHDQVRLAFITDTLEHCPYETLKASAVSWLKEEIITAQERKTDNIFSSPIALSATQPFLFPDTTALTDATDAEISTDLAQTFPYHMAVVNFLYFVASDKYSHVAPSSMFAVAEQIYLNPLKSALDRFVASSQHKKDFAEQVVELELLRDRIALCAAQLDAK